ncbi:purine-binding chemotaxis protein CheW [Natronospira proteinivora]|uniref:Purine-binding chemotaxis protein CheW n=1 Tax=Natronospira proteinivora TaxID=1807133 RepID=A0ABT1G596_9GAMM|nr:chemotaxis protein CheW [Natronospira proteinivora]MCP1726461.1 purine-binding chemotaxis protein CheW [Natronospira proteinivora]
MAETRQKDTKAEQAERSRAAQKKREERRQEPREQWVSFKLGRELYALKALHVQEILKSGDISPVPGAEHFVLGVINLRGNIVTVVDTCKRFGLSRPESDTIQQIIVVEADDQTLGLQVDDVTEVIDIRPSEVEAAPQFESDQVARHIQGVVRRDRNLVVLVDVRRLMPQRSEKQAAV